MDIQHKDIDTVNLHKFAYVASSDPGAVGAGVGWVDTSGSAPFPLFIRNAGDTAWDAVGDGSGGSTLASLSDVDLAGLSDGDTIVWDAGTSTWIPGVPSGGASDLASLTDVDIPSPADGEVLTFKSGSGKWEAEAPSGGGGGGSIHLYTPDLPYASPSTEDDEFDAGSLDPKWSIVGDTPDMAFLIPNHLSFGAFSASFNRVSSIMQSVSNVDQTFRMKVITKKGGNAHVGFAIKNTSGNAIKAYVVQSANNTYRQLQFGSLTSISSGVQVGADIAFSLGREGAIYLQFQYIASTTTHYFSVSHDGISFHAIDNQNFGTLDKIGIFTMGVDGNLYHIDWFRKLQGLYTGGNISVS